jgi:hypothetical protein
MKFDILAGLRPILTLFVIVCRKRRSIMIGIVTDELPEGSEIQSVK